MTNKNTVFSHPMKSHLSASKDKISGGTNNDTLIGGSYDDTLSGDSGNDVLDGKGGDDKLTGGSGNDIFVFSTKPNASTNVDTITDFSSVADTIQLDNSVFTSLGAVGILSADFFRSGAGLTTAVDANDFLIYNTMTGKLYYDADANGNADAAVQIALIGVTNHAALTTADFAVI